MRKRLGGSRKWKRGRVRADLTSRDSNRADRRSGKQKIAQLPLKYRLAAGRHGREAESKPTAVAAVAAVRELKVRKARQKITNVTLETTEAIDVTVDALLAETEVLSS